MSKLKKKGLVPELRFPEYRYADEWGKKPLNKIAKIVMGSSPKSSAYNKNGVGLPLLQGNADIKSRLSVPRIFTSQITKECEIDDILLSVRAPVGTVAKSKHNACIGRGMAAIRAIHGNYQEFIYQWLLHFEPFWSDISQGGTFDAVNSDDIRKLLAPIPEKEEQKKIADCLSSLDELITAHTQKHEALQSYKKGLLQKLFPAEDETVPALRFPKFGAEPDWVEEKFGDITNFSSGGTPSKGREDYWDGDIPWISAASMHDITIEDSERCITKLAVEEGARLAVKGTLLLLVRGSMLHKRIPLGIAGRDVAFNQDVKALNLKKPIFEEFLLYLLIASELRLLGAVTKTGIGAGKLDTADLKDFRFRIPLNTKEQQKIADCLSSVDNLIRAQAQKIEELKDHKKGLMQKLFPNMDEVSR
ncbi:MULTISPECIES: restriction endonuclease subunit S [Pseudoalteromonas]|uniref:Type I restriction modification DNA specificity domain-containing protein n=1 Tax=Pseudoalteromonas amylolytica TaxID=1859457 RepID=A0A1S1MYK1_9GAMM|nr:MULTISPECIES: restriction endonuclease subunit S [Pseudoalteromonas]OHU89207.1 hypothetical protein BFC16_06100 [Pseudoalteromonas sp. JW3]OHU92107.1 hypothetical protein BET10_07205 [Pseudoalteromonas amylolytica]